MSAVTTLVASVDTSDATATLLWTAPAGDISVIIWAQAFQTGLGRADSKRFARYATRYTNGEAGVVVTNSPIIEESIDVGYSMTIQNNDDALEVLVTGLGGQTVRWTAQIQHWNPLIL